MNADKMLDEALVFANEESIFPLYGFLMKTEDLVFEERVKMNCFYCGKYGKNWKCPPYLPQIDYRKMFSEFSNCAAIYVKVPIDNDDYDNVRVNSSVILHKGLLKMEKYIWKHNNSTYLSFIAGSCKLCKNGCGEKSCSNPYMARSPIEATGVNIVETAKKYGFSIDFPCDEYMVRIGLILW